MTNPSFLVGCGTGAAMDEGNLGSDIKSVFYRVDSDRNGKIDIKELYTALKLANENHFNPETCQLLMGKSFLLEGFTVPKSIVLV